MRFRLRAAQQRSFGSTGSGHSTHHQRNVPTVGSGSRDKQSWPRAADAFLATCRSNRCPPDGFGNLIALPLKHGPRQRGNTLFLDEDFEPWPDQPVGVPFVASSLRRLSLAGDFGNRRRCRPPGPDCRLAPARSTTMTRTPARALAHIGRR